jgi:L-malate glycosyltransferase
MKLLFLAERFFPDVGGVSRSATRLVNSFSSLNIQVDVVVWSRFLSPGEILKDSPENSSSNINIYRIGLYRNWDLTMIHTLNLLENLHQQSNYNLIWGHYLFPCGFLGVWFGKLNQIKTLVSARGNDVDRGVFPPGDFARLQWTLQQADLITCVSEDLAQKINLVSQRKDIFVIKNAVDTQIFKPSLSSQEKLNLKQELALEKDDIILGFSGELREKKGQKFLLSMLSNLIEKNYKISLLIIGEIRHTQEAILQNYAVEFPQAYEKIKITGHIEESSKVAQYLQLCDLFLLPSIWEGLPNSLLEAMACECCCLASDAGGIPEILTPPINGFILPRPQLPFLTDGVMEFISLDKSLKQKIGQEARKTIVSQFSLEKEGLLLKKLINKLV